MIDDVLLPETVAPEVLGGGDDMETPDKLLRSFALCGLGGTGKTQIAVEYVYSRRDKFQAVFWVSADDKTILAEEFAHIAIDLQLIEQTEAQDLPAACFRVKGWLSNPVRSYNATNAPNNEVAWLLVFDNVDNLEILEEFWPTTGIGSVLVTSRDTQAKSQTYTANKGVDLAPFSTEEATEFIKVLTAEFSQDGHEKVIEQVADKLGGLPILITQVPRAMTSLRLSYRDLLRLCEQSGIEQVNQSGSDLSKSAQVSSAFSKIGLSGLQSKSLGLLQMISQLDPDRIPERILVAACSQSEIENFPVSLKEYYEARAQLTQSSLIHRNADTEEIWLHRIVQDVVQDNLDASSQAIVLESTIQALSLVWPFGELVDRFNTDRYDACATLFPCVVRLKKAQEVFFEKHPCNNPDVGAKLLNDAGW